MSRGVLRDVLKGGVNGEYDTGSGARGGVGDGLPRAGKTSARGVHAAGHRQFSRRGGKQIVIGAFDPAFPAVLSAATHQMHRGRGKRIALRHTINRDSVGFTGAVRHIDGKRKAAFERVTYGVKALRRKILHQRG